MASDGVYTQLQHRLVNSGEWDRIRSILSSRLNESGWTDQLRHRAKEHARYMDPLSFNVLLSELSPHAQTSMPLAVKLEVMNIIRQFVDKQFE